MQQAGILAVWLVILFLQSACSSLPVAPVPPPLRHATPVEPVADVDLLQISPAMEAFLERYILPYSNVDTRLNLLSMAVVENGMLGFQYEDEPTLTAGETFQRRSGNCISHANMVIALARRAGLDAYYQEIAIPPEWASRQDTLLIRRHINVVLRSPQ
ncbi:MAG: hypothetical protein KJO35_03940, partial [Gammaproteobacteria bacterium]|nr:hypothetical protein [Gammaproteobacteria bacterium]